MAPQKMTAREQLHRLVDELPNGELRAAQRYLVYLRNMGTHPLLRTLMEAPLDDEPETDEERAAVAEAREAVARGELMSHEEVRRELAL
jgi:hypothetical protein